MSSLGATPRQKASSDRAVLHENNPGTPYNRTALVCDFEVGGKSLPNTAARNVCNHITSVLGASLKHSLPG
jgi:hypothetical protein